MKKKIKKVNAAILIIGNEILSGRTQDKNTAFISNWLNSKCGISVNEVRIIPDNEKIIVKNILLYQKNSNTFLLLEELDLRMTILRLNQSQKHLKLNMNITKKLCLILEKYYGKRKFNDGRKKMSKMPRGSKLIYNPSSAAPGFMIKNVLSLTRCALYFKFND